MTQAATVPFCEACGYDITAVPAASICPECGTPVLPRPLDALAREESHETVQLGLVALLGTVACLGPFAAVFAVMTIRRGLRVLRLVNNNGASCSAAAGVPFAIGCACASLAISLLEMLVLAAF